MQFSVPKTIPLTASDPKLFIDLRAELRELFYGTSSQPGMSFDVIVRNVDKTQRCPCWDPIKEEADQNCKRCSGNGWLIYDKVYKTVKRKYIGKEEVDPAGQYEYDTSLFFFEHDAVLSEEGSLIEVVTDDMGNMASPVKYIKRHTIKDVEPLRGNHGRVEFYKLFVSKAE